MGYHHGCTLHFPIPTSHGCTDGYPMASQPSHLGNLGPPARSRHDLTWGRSWDMADMGKGKQNMGLSPRKSKKIQKKMQENPRKQM